MSFNWKDYLTLAEGLSANPNMPGPTEAALRAATSRAYYAAFQVAFQFGRAEKFSPTFTGDDHRKIREYFRNSAPVDQRRRKIATQLDRLYDFRRQVDYDDLLKQKPESIATYAISMAKIIFQCLDEIAHSH